jgi:hypothetical protein
VQTRSTSAGHGSRRPRRCHRRRHVRTKRSRWLEHRERSSRLELSRQAVPGAISPPVGGGHADWVIEGRARNLRRKIRFGHNPQVRSREAHEMTAGGARNR